MEFQKRPGRSGTRKAALPVLFAAALMFAAGLSCASFQKGIDSSDAKNVASMLDKGDTAALAKISSSPFLLDGEIVALPSDIEVFWTGLYKAGFKLAEVEEDLAAAADKDSAQQFGSGMEVRTFFKRYVPGDARLLSFKTADGKRVLVIVTHNKGVFRIVGFKGPFAI